MVKLKKLREAALSVLRDCMCLKEGERILIVVDNNLKIGSALKWAGEKLGGRTRLCKMKPTGVHGMEPPEDIGKKLPLYNILLLPTTYSLTHTKAVRKAAKEGARVASMPGITEDMFANLHINYGLVNEICKDIAKVLRGKSEISVETPSGTSINFSIKGRKIWVDHSGLFKREGHIGNLPSGEVALSPVEGTTNGVMVIDGIEKEMCKPKTKVIIQEGRVVDISDKNSKLAHIIKNIKNADNIAEFGIGANPFVSLIGNTLQDEKVFGTAHIAFGNSITLGGKVFSSIHIDAILLKPNILVE